MKSKFLFFSILSVLFSSISDAQNSNTTSLLASPFCIGLTYTSAAGGSGASILEPNNDYSCLASSPNPSWYFLKASQSGNVELSLSAPQDIDFIIYGPFTSYADILNNSGNLAPPYVNIVDCSYSSTNMETPSIPSISTGEYYLLLVTNYANSVQQISLTQSGGTGSLDCAVYAEAGIQFNHGIAFYDQDQNGIMDGADFGIPNVPISFSPTGGTAFSNSDGGFVFFNQSIPAVNYSTSAALTNWSLTTVSPYNYQLDSTNAISDTLYFGFTPSTPAYSSNADIIVNSVSCVNSNNTWINIQNDGTLEAQGNVIVTLDPDINYVSSTIPLDNQIGNDLYFSYDSLGLYQNLNFAINTSPDISLTALDTVLTILTVNMLDSLNNNIGTLVDSSYNQVLCSYDPNFKESLPNGGMSHVEINNTDSIEYVIHFQNTGSAPAVNINIKDTIEANLDISTFKLLSSSHLVNTSINSNNVVSFNFQNINLPDSLTNEPLSHGYVKFRISLTPGLNTGDSIRNTASIYFDNNAPIITDTTLNIINCVSKPDISNVTVVNNQINTNLTGPGYSFIWTYNGTVLTGESSSFLALDEAGTYSVTISDGSGCFSVFTYVLGFDGIGLNEETITIGPNPFQDFISINSSAEQIESLSIIDVAGREIYNSAGIGSTSIKINTSQIAAGTYLVKMTMSDNSISLKKLIKK